MWRMDRQTAAITISPHRYRGGIKNRHFISDHPCDFQEGDFFLISSNQKALFAQQKGWYRNPDIRRLQHDSRKLSGHYIIGVPLKCISMSYLHLCMKENKRNITSRNRNITTYLNKNVNITTFIVIKYVLVLRIWVFN